MTRAAAALGASAAGAAQAELRALLRTNSYYSNRIEGQHCRPGDIGRALQQHLSANADLARRQRLAVAHIQTEAACEAELAARGAQGQDVQRWLYSSEALTWLHGHPFLDGNGRVARLHTHLLLHARATRCASTSRRSLVRGRAG